MRLITIDTNNLNVELKHFASDLINYASKIKDGEIIIPEKEYKNLEKAFLESIIVMNNLIKRGKTMNEKPRLAIKVNNYCRHAICGVCHKWLDLKIPIPYAIFLADSYDPVCYNCSRKIDPGLHVMFYGE